MIIYKQGGEQYVAINAQNTLKCGIGSKITEILMLAIKLMKTRELFKFF